jgi:hypothetical protein
LRDWGIIDEDSGEEPDSDNEEGDIIEERGRQQSGGGAARNSLNLRPNT